MNDADLIAYLGGPARIADLMGLPRKGGAERVSNWRERGIPAKVKLDFPHIFLRTTKRRFPRSTQPA